MEPFHAPYTRWRLKTLWLKIWKIGFRITRSATSGEDAISRAKSSKVRRVSGMIAGRLGSLDKRGSRVRSRADSTARFSAGVRSTGSSPRYFIPSEVASLLAGSIVMTTVRLPSKAARNAKRRAQSGLTHAAGSASDDDFAVLNRGVDHRVPPCLKLPRQVIRRAGSWRL